jgi:ABC-type multidrug transport system fused ATPase/permease subunit
MDADFLKILIPLAAATRYCGFEVQRWTRARAAGMRGESEGFGLFVDATSMLTSIAYYVWLVVVAFRIGWLEALLVFVASMVIGTAVAFLTGADRLWKWALALTVVWPLTIALYSVVL